MDFFKISVIVFLVASEQTDIVEGIYLYFGGCVTYHWDIKLVALILKMDVRANSTVRFIKKFFIL